jgi:hypothetical protein
MKHITRPESNEFAPYWNNYIKLIPVGADVLQIMHDNVKLVEDVSRSFPPERLTIPHAPGEWTIQDVLAHLVDGERVLAYRALRFARNDPTELPGFDQDVLAKWSGANLRSLEDILDERRVVRQATILLFENLDDEALARGGIASSSFVTARALAYVIAGHDLHHLNSIHENYGE